MKLIPTIIQDESTDVVLMLGYMNDESLKKTKKTKKVWFYSRSKKRLWLKGETSKNYLFVKSIDFDCDKDTILIKVKPAGPTCHTGNYSCFKKKPEINPLVELFSTIEDRKKNLPKNSYTTSLFKGGINKIIGKVMEETTEVINASIRETKKRLIEETVDLLYHLFVLLSKKNIKLEDVFKEIEKRRNKKSRASSATTPGKP
ncbi:MAG TPA: bifunctional phosphoribosyl-AMP cyclohydrolase/phosphoribosyl-ATP diphosphatase [Candidatus Magasanikbacteria bacterium]|nr:bifunctional phosphoribosyl-AMP cyclohydrolase/phosphoribosyl-ATP diphosphatase [Candidatus Magasanikbacteria bacterium]